MQFYANKNRLPFKTILFFALVLFIAYLPISSFLFFLKNDTFTGYFPPKFFMSESIHAGYLPLWNPFINYGIPQYGDMSSGYWSPITWLIASTVGYNAYTFTMEVMLYLLLGGMGMFQLSKMLALDKAVCIIAAVAFMCGGYNVAHLQHFNWLSGAAFLPWCFCSYHALLFLPTFKNLVKAVLFFYLLISSAHPGISISAFYFFLAYLLFFLLANPQNVPFIKQRIKTAAKSHAMFIVLLLVLSAGMIIGYADIIPHFSRNEKVSLTESLLNPATFQSWISVVLPFATVKNDSLFNTDISMRNSYFSITLLLFFLFSLFNKRSKLQNFLLFTGIFFLLLSTGGYFKMIAYKLIPFIGYIRLNGEFRLFAVFCFIMVGAIAMNSFITQKMMFDGVVKMVYYFIEIIIIGAIAFGLYKTFATKESLIYELTAITTQHGITSKLKAIIDSISFYDTLWIQGLIQLFLLWGVKWALRFQAWSLVKKFVVVDMVIACLLNVPFTGAGKASVATIQNIIDKSPAGIPLPKLIPIKQYESLPANEKDMIGDWSFYGKQPGVTKQAAYPVVLKSTQNYFDSAINTAALVDKPFLFGKISSTKIVRFSPQQIEAEANTSSNDSIILQQNYYPHWYYTSVHGKKPVNKYKDVFISAPLAKGERNILFSFEPVNVKIAMLISLIAFVTLVVLAIDLKSTSKQSYLSSPLQ